LRSASIHDLAVDDKKQNYTHPQILKTQELRLTLKKDYTFSTGYVSGLGTHVPNIRNKPPPSQNTLRMIKKTSFDDILQTKNTFIVLHTL